MSHYSRNGLSLRIRANREVDETTVLQWSAEVATQWSRYEYMRGEIEIPIGESTGTVYSSRRPGFSSNGDTDILNDKKFTII